VQEREKKEGEMLKKEVMAQKCVVMIS